jgi:hypothetical protein
MNPSEELLTSLRQGSGLAGRMKKMVAMGRDIGTTGEDDAPQSHRFSVG